MIDKVTDDFEFDDEEDDEGGCEVCGRRPYDDGYCPMCCPAGGCYAPGTEECEFCEYSDECADFAANL
ncbi:MAG: hypothetical protein JW864_06170 [Spirochaetes bacterium]|nr:hypothetical protein [Spirochaetota bacterium]